MLRRTPTPHFLPRSLRARPKLQSRLLATTTPPRSRFLSETPDNSFQKAAKAQRKARNLSKTSSSTSNSQGAVGVGRLGEDGVLWNGIPGASGRWEIVCGLEIHAQLNTERKLFSNAKTSFNESPNEHVALFDAALPGSQPIFQPTALLPALRAAVALHCNIMSESRFDRKHYFYWDQPGGYQITQFYHPLAKDGHLKLLPSDGAPLAPGTEFIVGIKQVQMEQDTAKTLTTPSVTPNAQTTHLIDLNRVSHPLIEIITTPCIPSAHYASLTLRKLQHMLRVSHAAVLGMEWGGLRCDVNVSVRPRGSGTLGQRVELKNLASVKLVEEAVLTEARRQVSVLEAGGEVIGETRGWDAERETTYRLRGKEGEVDYRYMPEPDVPPVVVGMDLVEWIKGTMPELPDQTLKRLVKPVDGGQVGEVGEAEGEGVGEYGLTVKDAGTLMAWDNGARVGYYEEVVRLVREELLREGVTDQKALKDVGRVVGNWVIHDLPSLLSSPPTSPVTSPSSSPIPPSSTISTLSPSPIPWSQNPISISHLSAIISLLFLSRISKETSKFLLSYLISTHIYSTASLDLDLKKLIADNNLLIIPLSEDELTTLIKDVINPSPSSSSPSPDPQSTQMRQQHQTLHSQLLAEKLKDPAGQGKKVKGLEKKLFGLRNWFVGRVVKAAGGRVDAKKVEAAVGGVLEEILGSESTAGEKICD